jgi:hypothetical protein
MHKHDNGIEFVTFAEGIKRPDKAASKRNQDLHVKPKMFANGHETRCPVALFKICVQPECKEQALSIYPLSIILLYFRCLVYENTNGQEYHL